jgi:transcriptional regulator with XRE-family HTH domain
MTWEQFAEAVGVSYKGVRRWLDKNNPTLIRKKNLERIAEVMDCDIEYLECKQGWPRCSSGHRIKLSELSTVERYLPGIRALLETTTARFTYKLELSHGKKIEDSFIDGETKYHYIDYDFDKEVSEIYYQVSINGAEPVRVSEQRLETMVKSIMKKISKEIKFLEEDKEMYPNITKEMNRANMTAEELAEAVSMVPEDLIEALRGEKDFTFFQASKIKKALGSELLIEELFETKGE